MERAPDAVAVKLAASKRNLYKICRTLAVMNARIDRNTRRIESAGRVKKTLLWWIYGRIEKSLMEDYARKSGLEYEADVIAERINRIEGERQSNSRQRD